MRKNLVIVLLTTAILSVVFLMAAQMPGTVTSISFDAGKTKLTGDVTVEIISATGSHPVVSYDSSDPTHPRVRVEFKEVAPSIAPSSSPAPFSGPTVTPPAKQ